jgi:hypothetical protein
MQRTSVQPADKAYYFPPRAFVTPMVVLREHILFVGISAAVVITNLVIFQLLLMNHINNAKPFLYDKSELDTIRHAVQMVPHNESIVTPNQAPIVSYFTDHRTIVPYDVKSEKQLVNFMHRWNVTYILVFENITSEGVSRPLFSTSSLSIFNSDFTQLAQYHSDYSRIDLYHLRREGVLK